MAAIAFYKAGIKAESEEITAEMKQDLLESSELEENLVRTLREIAEIDVEMDAFYGLSERLLELKPDDDDTRFNLAYKYSQDDKDNLSLYQYLRIPRVNRGSVVWNNLGAQYDNFEMPGLSVSCYRTSEQAGETIAMSNLANKLIKVGFLSEAEEICRKALSVKDYHKNVNFSMTRIREIPDEEATKEEEIVKQAAHLSDFYRAYGRALCKPNASEYTGEWEGPECHLNVSIRGFNFVAEGTYKIAQGLGLAAVATAYMYPSLALHDAQAQPENHLIKYKGRLSGYGIKAVMTEELVSQEGSSAGKPKGLLGIPDKSERTVLMVISDSLDEIRVYDQKGPKNKQFYVLRRLKM